MKLYSFPEHCVAIDTETTGLWPWKGHRMFAAAATFPNGEQLFWREDNYNFAHTTLRTLCEDPNVDKVFSNAKYDIRMLEYAGIEVKGQVWDTMILCHLLDGRDAEGGLSLEAQAAKYVPNEEGKIVDEITQAFGEMGVKFTKKRKSAADDGINFQHLPKDLLQRRVMGDSRLTMAIFKRVFNTVAVHFPYLLHQEHRLIRVVKKMEDRGLLIDPEEIDRQGAELTRVVGDVIEFCEGILGWDPFNINSPQHQRALLEKAGIYDQITEWTKPKKNRKSAKPFCPQRKMDEYNLRSLHHPVAHMLLLGKAAKKLISPFLTGALDLSVDNVLHASFRQCGTTSGRFSCSDPNLQNIPTEGNRKANLTEAEAQEAFEMTGYRLAPHIKRIFKVRPGMAHIHADKKQAEMVALAHYTGDPKLIEIFERGESIHDGICKLMFGGQEITKGLKQKSKSVTFGYQYGAGLPALAKKFNGDLEEAKKMKERLEATFVYLPQWKRDLEREIITRGYVTTLHGRRHYLRKNETYMAVNRVCQGTVGDEVKNRMIALDDMFQAEGMHEATVILNIHDDIATELPAARVPEWGPKIYRCMSEMSLPYRVNMASSMDVTYTSWADLKEIEKPHDPSSYPIPS